MTTRSPSPPKPDCLVGLPPIQPPMPPAFPAFEELVAEDAQRQPPTAKKLSDLFDGTLGDLTLLVSDYQRSPEKYGEAEQALLEQLMHGSKSLGRLSSSERLILNMATLNYHQADRPQRVRKPDPPRKPTRAKPRKRQEPRPGLDVPVTELPAYWWLR